MILTSFKYYDKPKIDQAADFCLQPCRYLFGGKKVTAIKCGTIEKDFIEMYERKQFPQKKFWKTVVAILLLIPGLLIGLTLKLLNICSKNYRTVSTEYQRQKKAQELLCEPSSTPKRVYVFAALDEKDARCKIPLKQIRERYTQDVQMEVMYNYHPERNQFDLKPEQADAYFIRGIKGNASHWFAFDGDFPAGVAYDAFHAAHIQNRRCVLVQTRKRPLIIGSSATDISQRIKAQKELHAKPVTMEYWKV